MKWSSNISVKNHHTRPCITKTTTHMSKEPQLYDLLSHPCIPLSKFINLVMKENQCITPWFLMDHRTKNKRWWRVCAEPGSFAEGFPGLPPWEQQKFRDHNDRTNTVLLYGMCLHTIWLCCFLFLWCYWSSRKQAASSSRTFATWDSLKTSQNWDRVSIYDSANEEWHAQHFMCRITHSLEIHDSVHNFAIEKLCISAN